MDKHPALLYKSLVVGVVVLFIGVGIQPAFAITPDSEENCNCKKLNDSELVKVERLLNKVEVYCKSLLVLSKYNPETKDEIEELSEKISTLKEELADKAPFKVICLTLDVIYNISKGICVFFDELALAIVPYFYFFYFLAIICSKIANIIKFNIFFIGALLSCWEWLGPNTGTLIVKILDTKGGSPQEGVTVEIINGTHGVLTKTFANGKAFFFSTPHKDYDVRVNFIFVETIEFYQLKLEVTYYLDEIYG
jgi:hypothetical protein